MRSFTQKIMKFIPISPYAMKESISLKHIIEKVSVTTSVTWEYEWIPKQDSKTIKQNVKFMDLTTSKLKNSIQQIAQYKNVKIE